MRKMLISYVSRLLLYWVIFGDVIKGHIWFQFG